MTEQRVIGDGLTYTYESDFLVRCMETALGYFSISFDLSRVAYPEEDGDGWEQLSKALGTTIGIYGQSFRGFHAARGVSDTERPHRPVSAPCSLKIFR